MVPLSFIVLLGLQLLGLVWFLKGFFPKKVTLSGFSEFSDTESPFVSNSSAHFEKVIVIVVDALRSDFMFSDQDSQMPFLHSLIREGYALPFTAFSHPPTVTLPRLKGITTGGTPSFIDAMLNIADDADLSQSLENTDSWIHQFKFLKNERAIHFFGDDTWLKLFPASVFFEKFEGTSSFFVSDFTEVDSNVTRHLQKEIGDESWDALILHYLGLDHIGHKGGPDSVFMGPKQTEMDNVLKLLYDSRVSTSNDTLLVLLGDHGMNNVGNHGGASAGETSPGLILASPKFALISAGLHAPIPRNTDFKYFSSMSQIDIVPSLAALLDFPIPKNNLGIVLPDILKLWQDKASQEAVLLENCKQFMNFLAEKYDKTNSKFRFFLDEFEHLQKNPNLPLGAYYSFLEKIQTLLVEESTNYCYSDITCGFAILVFSFFLIWSGIFKSISWKESDSRGSSAFFICFCVFYSLHFHGSSLIEEEHQLWWFLTVAVLFFHFLLSRFKGGVYFIQALLALRIIKGWNNSGQKFSSDYAIAKFLVAHRGLNWFLVLLTYLYVFIQLLRNSHWKNTTGCFGSKAQRCEKIITIARLVSVFVVSSLSILYKLRQFFIDGFELPIWLTSIHLLLSLSLKPDSSFDQKDLQSENIKVCQFFFLGLAIICLGEHLTARLRWNRNVWIKDFGNAVTLFLIHQTKIEVIPIFLVFFLLKIAYKNILVQVEAINTKTRVVLITLFVLCLQNLSFFSIGNTNLLATVDLSNSFNGIPHYSIIFVGLLTFVSNFAVAIYWSISAAQFLVGDSNSWQGSSLKSRTSQRAFLILAFYSISALNLVGSCINLRFHLFIWSVFSPKLLYFSAWVILLNSGVDNLLNFLLQLI